MSATVQQQGGSYRVLKQIEGNHAEATVDRQEYTSTSGPSPVRRTGEQTNGMNPQTEERSASPELLEQVPEVEARVVEEMTTKVLGPVREITEGARGAIKKIIVENAALFIRARTMFAAQGRRALVETQNKRRK